MPLRTPQHPCRWAMTVATGLAAILVVGVGGCGSSTTHTATPPSTGEPQAPPGDLYQPPTPLPLGPPGALIWAQRVAQPGLNPPSVIWRILYHSRNRIGQDVAVSGFAIVPTRPCLPGSGDRSTPGLMV